MRSLISRFSHTVFPKASMIMGPRYTTTETTTAAGDIDQHASSTSSPNLINSVSTAFKGSPEDFIAKVQQSTILVASFTAPWCKPCHDIRDEYEALAEKYVKGGSSKGEATNDDSKSNSSSKLLSPVTFVDVDITVNDGLAALHDVRCVPTFCCYIGGKIPSNSPQAQDASVNPMSNNNESAANNESINISPDSDAPPAVGLFGTVEGAHLDKVKLMIRAAQKEVLKSKYANHDDQDEAKRPEEQKDGA